MKQKNFLGYNIEGIIWRKQKSFTMDVSTKLKRLMELKQLYEEGKISKEEMESERPN